MANIINAMIALSVGPPATIAPKRFTNEFNLHCD